MHTRISEGFEEQKMFVLPDYLQSELSGFELTRDLFVTDIGFFPQACHHDRDRPEGALSAYRNVPEG